MGRKRKKGRCVKNNTKVNIESEEQVQAPHSFVIHRGLPTDHVLELTKDFRKVMEPYTAASLKERRRNTIKDFVSIAGPLHVSHLLIFSGTEVGIYLKTARLPRGPTLTFKIHNFSLSRDVVSSLKRQSVVERAFKHSPLIVLNSFSSESKHMKLMASMFQNMFPTLNLTNVDLNTVRRCVLLNYNPSTKLIDFRHYVIKVVPVGVSKGVKKVVQGKIPNLTRCNEIDEFFTKAGMMSESEAEDDPNHHVTVPQKLSTRGNIESRKSSIKLSELGPRLTLQLVKIEDGLLDGEVLYHEFIEKSEEEKLEIQKRREAKKKLKEKRKNIQEKNKKEKERAKQELKEKSLRGMKKSEGVEEAADDDVAYYREEVGEEPDRDLFTTSQTSMKPPKTPHFYKHKRKFEGGREDKDSFNNKRLKRSDKKRDRIQAHNRDNRPIGGKQFRKSKGRK